MTKHSSKCRTSVTRDHLLPASMGGKLIGHNRVVVCRRCNGAKGNMTLEVWLSMLVSSQDPRASFVTTFMESLRESVPRDLYELLVGGMK